MNRSIEKVASEIEKDWAKSGQSNCELPEIAARHLDRSLRIDPNELIQELSEARALPPQRLMDQSFGQPQVTLYSGEKLQVEILFWHSGTPAIHQHAFDGAFRLLVGRSAHCQYRFEPHGETDGVVTGRLDTARFEILSTSHAVQIPHGSGLIHSVFHIDSPSITLVVRTPQEDVPELTYLPPGVAYDTAARSVSLHKKLQLLDTLAATRHPKYAAGVEAAIAAGDAYDGLAILIRASAHAIDDRTFGDFAQRLRSRHHDRDGVDMIVQAGYAERRRIRLVRSRQSMTDPDQRVLLATLLGFDDREPLFKALVDYAGSAEAANDLIISSVGRLFDLDADREILARAAASTRLAGCSTESFLQTVADLQGNDLSNGEKQGLIRFYQQLTEHWLVAPLFEEPEHIVRAAS